VAAVRMLFEAPKPNIQTYHGWQIRQAVDFGVRGKCFGRNGLRGICVQGVKKPHFVIRWSESREFEDETLTGFSGDTYSSRMTRGTGMDARFDLNPRGRGVAGLYPNI